MNKLKKQKCFVTFNVFEEQLLMSEGKQVVHFDNVLKLIHTFFFL